MGKLSKILQLTPYYYPSTGGIENHVFNLSRKLMEEGYEVEILTPRCTTYDFKDSIATYRTLGVARFRRAVLSPGIISKLLCLDYDLIHVHAPFHFGFEFSVITSQILRKKPLIVTVHVYGGSDSLLYRLYDKLVYDNCLKIAKRIIITTRDYVFSAKVFEQLKDKVEEVPMAVDTDFFYPRCNKRIRDKLGLSKDKVILFIGSLEKYHQYKRVDDLLRAFSIIVNQGSDVVLVIIGKGELVTYLKKLASNLGINNRVYFEGFVPHKELPEYYSVADVSVLPSIGRAEAFGIVLIEAMACGSPVVGPDLEGVRSVIGDAGFTFQAGNVIDLAEKVSQILNSDRFTFSKKGRERVLSNYSWNHIIGRISKIYEEQLTQS